MTSYAAATVVAAVEVVVTSAENEVISPMLRRLPHTPFFSPDADVTFIKFR